MVLMKPGCWHDTVWADRSWPEDQWLEYGTPAVTPAATGGGGAGGFVWPPIRPLPEKPVEVVVPQPLPLKTVVALLVDAQPKPATLKDFETMLRPYLQDLAMREQRSYGDVIGELKRLFQAFKQKPPSLDKLRDLLKPLKRDAEADGYATLRGLLADFNVSYTSFSNGLRKTIKECMEEN